MPRLPALLLPTLLLLALLPGCTDPRTADCRALGLDTGWRTCLPPDTPPPPPPYCTRTLGRVECWANPRALPGPPPQVADGPRASEPFGPPPSPVTSPGKAPST
jgi:hypothetical protein